MFSPAKELSASYSARGEYRSVRTPADRSFRKARPAPRLRSWSEAGSAASVLEPAPGPHQARARPAPGTRQARTRPLEVSASTCHPYNDLTDGAGQSRYLRTTLEKIRDKSPNISGVHQKFRLEAVLGWRGLGRLARLPPHGMCSATRT